MSDDERWRRAWHESGHAVLAHWLLGPASVELVSLRSGDGHLAVTLFAPVEDHARSAATDWIVVRLAGDLAAWQAEPVGDIVGPTDERVADAASLERLAPDRRARLLASEAAPGHPDHGDEQNAFHQAHRLAMGDPLETGLCLAYSRAVAARQVRQHHHAIRAVARALFRETTIDGATVAALTRGSRCVCHGWTPPEEVERLAALSHPPKPNRST